MNSDEGRVAGRHLPVLPTEIVNGLAPARGECFVDATAGAGGHARLIAEKLGPQGLLIALDRDESMLRLARAAFEESAGLAPVRWMHASFADIRQVLDELKVQEVDGILADLGVCSAQLDSPERGFSFQSDGPLDMRLDPSGGEPARDLIKRLDERDLADVIYQFGEERLSRRIARKIVETRKHSPIETTGQLADLVRSCFPRPRHRHGAIDPATRTFQALRIAVNDELESLDRFLELLPGCLRPGGRAAIISFHSLEDRRVKQAFRNKENWEVLTKKPVQAGDEEVRNNPRSRSAKLRVARRI